MLYLELFHGLIGGMADYGACSQKALAEAASESDINDAVKAHLVLGDIEEARADIEASLLTPLNQRGVPAQPNTKLL